METGKWTYLLILVLSVLYPLAQSFERRVYMYRKFRFIMPGILLAGAIYLAWDVAFAHMGVWGFSHERVVGIYFLGLPLEEWMFFLIVPWCCFFIYEVLRYFVKRFYFPKASLTVLLILLGFFLVLIPFNIHRTYTLSTLSFTSLMLLLALVQKRHLSWLSGFFLTYLVSLVPFVIVNGFLTSLPVVWYDNDFNFGLRFHSIPVEDFIYLLGLLLAIQHVYQFLLRRKASAKLRSDMKLGTKSGF